MATQPVAIPGREGPDHSCDLAVFPSDLGWMALVGLEGKLMHLTFGHASQEAAIQAIPAALLEDADRRSWHKRLIDRLCTYASGGRVEFGHIEIHDAGRTPFQRRVLAECRRIRYGQTLTYGRLAEKADSLGAARAVGRCMANNPVPLVVPCHRVVGSGGRLRGYSAAGGIAMKRKLLAIEACLPPAPTETAARGGRG